MAPLLVAPESPTRGGLANPRVDGDQRFKKSAQARRERRRRCLIRVGSWNVRSLVESEGNIETASIQNKVVEDRKLDLVISELHRLSLDVAGVQETHWFGEHLYEDDKGNTVITSGRAVDANTHRRRGEGVALILNKFSSGAWKAGGSFWRSFGPRVVLARLKLPLSHPRGVNNPKSIYVISAYAPTFASPRTAKDEFFHQLQCAINVCKDHQYILLGDFNARVGSGMAEDEWGRVRGPHGLGQLNSAGTELLSFLSMNKASLCNTWFAKRDIFKRTWQHPGSMAWHCIDYIIVRQADQRQCMDVTTVRNAECGSDHELLTMSFDLDTPAVRRRAARHSPPVFQFDVAKSAWRKS